MCSTYYALSVKAPRNECAYYFHEDATMLHVDTDDDTYTFMRAHKTHSYG